MPNRIIKESICTSDNINNLSLEEEVFFYRLLVHCDDYGLMDARPAILRAKCFPLKVDKIKLSQIEKWLHSLVKNQLIALYEYDGRPYLKMLSWEKHQQIRSRKTKYPLPPEDIPCNREHIMPEEKDIEDLLYDVMSSTKRFEEHTLLSVERQVRVGESYLDIVAKTESSETLVFELKRGRLSNKAIDQISKYLTLINGNGILIGCGLSANFDIERCRSNDIAVVIYDDDLNMSLVLSNSAVNSIDLTLNHVKSRYAKLASNPIQSNPIQSESESESNTNNNDAPAQKQKPEKIKYADFVSLTNAEYKALVAKLGEDGAKRCIEILDNYKGSTGRKYKSDYRTILNWVVQRYEDEQQRKKQQDKPSQTKQPPQATNFKQRTYSDEFYKKILNRF